MAASSERLFFALWPPADVARSIAERVARADVGGRLVAVDRLHLTLAFYGPCDRLALAALRDRGESVALPPFELVLDRVGHFRRARVSWLAPSVPPPTLTTLAATLAPWDDRQPMAQYEFRPHVTVGRRARAIAPAPVSPIVWFVTGFSLVVSGSAGAPGAYRELAHWSLEAEPVRRARL